MKWAKRLIAKGLFAVAGRLVRLGYWLIGETRLIPDIIANRWLYFRPGSVVASGYFVHIDEVETAIHNCVTAANARTHDHLDPKAVARGYTNHMHDHMESVIDGTYDPCDESA